MTRERHSLMKEFERLYAESIAKRERLYLESIARRDRISRDYYATRAVINMPVLYLDHRLDIEGYSGDFPMLLKSVVDFSNKRKNIKEFLDSDGYHQIVSYLEKIDSLESLPYHEGEEWKLRYRGPDADERIGVNWLASSSCSKDKWIIINDYGKPILYHIPHISDEVDCYLIYNTEYGGADQDIKVIYRIKTSEDIKLIRDISLVISASSGREEAPCDIVGYSICSGSNCNTMARIQRQIADKISQKEVLRPNAEYEITVERTGGKISRALRNLETEESGPSLVMIDPNAIYDKGEHIGFTTFGGEVSILDIQIYTRKSRFSIEQFKIPFNAEVTIRDYNLKEKYFKLRIDICKSMSKAHYSLYFEDITERIIAEIELKKSREQLRELARHLQLIREEERSSIAREIHDELGQSLTALQLDLYNLRKKLSPQQEPLVEKINTMLKIIDNTNTVVHRISSDLRPGLLDDLGLPAAIEWLLEEFECRTGIMCEFNPDEKVDNLDRIIATNIFRICQEALTNIARHAGAALVTVNLTMNCNELILEVKDNGKGITATQISDPKSLGLVGMRERVNPWGGEFEINGDPIHGTVVKVSIPMDVKET